MRTASGTTSLRVGDQIHGGFLGLVLLAIGAVVAGRLRRWREILFLAVPAGLYLFMAMGSDLNIGARHILPMWVFLCMFRRLALGAG